MKINIFVSSMVIVLLILPFQLKHKSFPTEANYSTQPLESNNPLSATSCSNQMVVFPLEISGNGNLVVFDNGLDIADNDLNGNSDITVHDRLAGQTTVASKPSLSGQSNGSSLYSSVSHDGRFVVFISGATNLVEHDTNGKQDVFLKDRQTDLTERISVSSNGVQADADSNGVTGVSSDGRYVVFSSDATNLISNDTNSNNDVFLQDRQLGTTKLISVSSTGIQGNAGSSWPVISDDGQYIAYWSDASNLVTNDNNGKTDVFVFDRNTQMTQRVSTALNGGDGNGSSLYVSISGDGYFISFVSSSTNLVANDSNGVSDIFVYNRHTGLTTRDSVATNGSQSNGTSQNPSISYDGRYVAFNSIASNLVANDTNGYSDIFVHDRLTGETMLVSASSQNGQANCGSLFPSISGDGRYVAFKSLANNLTPGDLNTSDDPYVYDRQTGKTTLESIASKRPWTLLFYIDSDTGDLDYSNEFNQLESVANNPNTHVVSLLDQEGDSNSAYYHITYDTDPINFAHYHENYNYWPRGEVNMGDSNTLSNFINWARVKYPAQHYAVVLADHGTGLGGGMIDMTSGYDQLSVKELGQAFSMATSNDYGKIDVLYMNACLMAMIEDAYELRSYVNYYVASENLALLFPDPFASDISGITASSTPSDVAKLFTNVYSDFGTLRGKPLTMSASDLSQLSNLLVAVNSLAQAITNATPDHLVEVGFTEGQVQRFNMNGDKVINTSDTYIDVYDFARLSYQNITDDAVKMAAQNVMSAANSYVILPRKNSGFNGGVYYNLDNSNGVSIFFPHIRSSFYNGDNYSFAAGTDWSSQNIKTSIGNPETISWGPMLVNYLSISQPGGPNDPNIPIPLPPLTPSKDWILFLPLISK